jgi:hypothetical protein
MHEDDISVHAGLQVDCGEAKAETVVVITPASLKFVLLLILLFYPIDQP